MALSPLTRSYLRDVFRAVGAVTRELRPMRLRARPQGAAQRFKSTPQPAPDTPWRDAAWCAVDLELTGLDAALG